MRFMIIVKGNKDTEAGKMPPEFEPVIFTTQISPKVAAKCRHRVRPACMCWTSIHAFVARGTCR
jgi:hypothetical protein